MAHSDHMFLGVHDAVKFCRAQNFKAHASTPPRATARGRLSSAETSYGASFLVGSAPVEVRRRLLLLVLLLVPLFMLLL